MDKRFKYIAAVILIMTASFFYKLYISGDLSGIKASVTNESIIDTLDTTIPSSSIESMSQVIKIYICGHINTPGIYEVEKYSILNDVVVMADGLTDDASASHINLVYILKENLTIYIPSENEIMDKTYDESLNQPGIIIGSNNSLETPIENKLININTASKDELTSLPGIGSSTADKIISYRENTPFASIEDLMNVPGIGESKFNGIKDMICV